MRVLLDTNILIQREDARELSPQLSELLRLLQANGIQQLIHPRSLQELKGDPDKKRREIALSKVRAYAALEQPPEPEEEFLQRIGVGANRTTKTMRRYFTQ